MLSYTKSYLFSIISSSRIWDFVLYNAFMLYGAVCMYVLLFITVITINYIYRVINVSYNYLRRTYKVHSYHPPSSDDGQSSQPVQPQRVRGSHSPLARHI